MRDQVLPPVQSSPPYPWVPARFRSAHSSSADSLKSEQDLAVGYQRQRGHSACPPGIGAVTSSHIWPVTERIGPQRRTHLPLSARSLRSNSHCASAPSGNLIRCWVRSSLRMPAPPNSAPGATRRRLQPPRQRDGRLHPHPTRPMRLKIQGFGLTGLSRQECRRPAPMSEPSVIFGTLAPLRCDVIARVPGMPPGSGRGPAVSRAPSRHGSARSSDSARALRQSLGCYARPR